MGFHQRFRSEDHRLRSLADLDPATRRDIEGMLSRLETMTSEDLGRLAATYDSVDEAARDRAHDALQTAGVPAGRKEATRDIQAHALDRIRAMLSNSQPASVWIIGDAQPLGSPTPEIARSFAPATLDAIAAVILSDWLGEADYDALFSPWEVAIDEFDAGAAG